MSPLFIVGVHTFCFVGSVALAAWGEFEWSKVALAVILGVCWLDSFCNAWRAAERFDGHARGCDRQRIVLRSGGQVIVDVPCRCALDALYRASALDEDEAEALASGE